MSNYCEHCRYQVNVKNGENACPFNYLYWDFLIRNRDKLQDNRRLAFPYKSLNKMSKEKVQAIRNNAKQYLDSLTYW